MEQRRGRLAESKEMTPMDYCARRIVKPKYKMMAAPSEQASVNPVIVNKCSLQGDDYMASEGCSSENANNCTTETGIWIPNEYECIVKEEPVDIEMNVTENDLDETTASLTPTLLRQLRAPAMCTFPATDQPHPVMMIKAVDHSCAPGPDTSGGKCIPSPVPVKRIGCSPKTKITPDGAKTEKKKGRPLKKKGTRKKKKPFQKVVKSMPDVEVSSLVQKPVQKQEPSKEQLWVECIVCHKPCPLVKNRKLPNLPFCKRCKKAYFFQMNGSRQKPRVCSRMGDCKIHHAVGVLCSPCHFKKIEDLVRQAREIEDDLPSDCSLPERKDELLRRMGLLNKCCARENMGISETVDELIKLERKALSTVPYVKLERLQLDAEGNPIVSPQVSGTLTKVKQEPLEINWFQNATISNEYGKESYEEEHAVPPVVRKRTIRKKSRIRNEKKRNQKSSRRKGQTSSTKSRRIGAVPNTFVSPKWAMPQGLKIFLFTCGHACSKCNKDVDKKWLNEKGFKIVAPCTNRVARRNQRGLVKNVISQPELAQKTFPRPEHVVTLTSPVQPQVLAAQHFSTPRLMSSLTQPASPQMSANPVSPPQIPFIAVSQLPRVQSPLISHNSTSVLNQIAQAGGPPKQTPLLPMLSVSEAHLSLQSPAVVSPNISINNHFQVFVTNQAQSNSISVGSTSLYTRDKPKTSSRTESTGSDVQINKDTRKVLLRTLHKKNPALSNQHAGETGQGLILPCTTNLSGHGLGQSTETDPQTQPSHSARSGPASQLNESALSDEPSQSVNSSNVSQSGLVQSLQQVLEANPNAKLILSNVPRQ